MPEKTFSAVRVNDRFTLIRAAMGQPVGAKGHVTMKCRDGISGELQVRVKFDGVLGEPFVRFPTSDLEFATCIEQSGGTP